MKKYLLLLLLICNGVLSAQETFSVYFDVDIDEVNAESAQKFSQWAAENQDAHIVKIYGYADNRASDDYNMQLSMRRAKHVLLALKNSGLQFADDFELKALGESMSQSDDHVHNRRVDVVFTKPSTLPITEEKTKEELPNPVEAKKEKLLAEEVSASKKGEKLQLKNLHFYDNSDVVLPGSRKVLSELLQIMRDNPALKIDIQGHICCQSDDRHNIAGKRAKTVYKFLVDNGISRKRLSHHSFGSTRPVYPIPEKTEEERIANRRVEIEILDK